MIVFSALGEGPACLTLENVSHRKRIIYHQQFICHLYRPHDHQMMDILCLFILESEKPGFLAVPARKASEFFSRQKTICWCQVTSESFIIFFSKNPPPPPPGGIFSFFLICPKSPLVAAAGRGKKKCLKSSSRRSYYPHRSRDFLFPLCGIF